MKGRASSWEGRRGFLSCLQQQKKLLLAGITKPRSSFSMHQLHYLPRCLRPLPLPNLRPARSGRNQPAVPAESGHPLPPLSPTYFLPSLLRSPSFYSSFCLFLLIFLYVFFMFPLAGGILNAN